MGKFLKLISLIITLGSILVSASVIFAQVLLINNKIYTLTNNNSVTEEQLRDIGFNIVKNERIYLIYNKKLIIGSGGDFLVDFEDYIQKAYTITNNKILVRVDALSKILKLSKFENIFYDKPGSIDSVSYDEDSIEISTSVPVSEEFIDVNYSNKTLTIKLTPFELPKNITQGLSVSKVNSTVIITLSKEIEKYALSISNKNITILLTPVVKKIEHIKRTETFAGRSFVVNYIIADPKYVDFTPLLPSKGIGSTATLLNILVQNGFLHGVNANYFDPATGMPIDIVIKNGRVISHRYGLRPMFIETYDDMVFIGKNYVDITTRIGDVLLLVKGVNTKSISEVNIYTEEYSLKIPKDISKMYLLVKNGKISSIGYVEYVPSNSMVIMISNELQKKYLPDLSVGMNVSIELYTDSGYKIKNAVGAGPLLLQNGAIISDASEEKLRYGGGIPTTRTDRTIIAIKDSKVHLITIEGTNGVGMNFDEVAQFLLSKGYQSAMMLDGGGSTSMVYNEKLVTKGTMRNIPVALGVK
ncbi:MAG: phosphodiester glycosidase family protein [Fervidobacterium sp.]